MLRLRRAARCAVVTQRTAAPVVTLRRALSSASSSQFSDLKRGPEREKLKFVIGDVMHGFKVTQERNLKCYRLVHAATQAEHLHIEADDTENAFCVMFKTVPMNSTGVAHILEHTTLCGSRKFPVRDPFFNMLKRSMNTYMNAMTSSDWTMYLFATQNAADFTNLLSMNLDATFFPLLNELDFMQEGHRWEFKDEEEGKHKLALNGVVFNEMKGAMSDPANYFVQRQMSALFPSITYHYNSGGDPLTIPQLSYDELKKFHETHYHPKNARFFTYGDLPLSLSLGHVNQTLMDWKDERKTELSIPVIPPESRYPKPVEVTEVGPLTRTHPDSRAYFKILAWLINANFVLFGLKAGEQADKQTTVAVSYLLTDVKDRYETKVLSVLSSLLVSGANSPFFQSLIHSGLGTDFAPSTGYDTSIKETSFSVGLMNVPKDKVGAIRKAIQSTLETVAKEGFPAKRIEALLHRYEVSLKHISTNFGIGLVTGVATPWIHGEDPIDWLQFLDRLKVDLDKDAQFFQRRVRKYFLENQHCVTYIMHGDEKHNAELKEQEERIVAERDEQLSDTAVAEIAAKSGELEERQASESDKSCLPTIKISDLPRKALSYVTEQFQLLPDVPAQWSTQPTNGLAYFQLKFNLSALPERFIPLLPLWCTTFSSLGTNDLSYTDVDQEMNMYTGGINAKTIASPHPEPAKPHLCLLAVSAACLYRNLKPTMGLLRSLLDPTNRPHRELDRLKSLLQSTILGMQEALGTSGHHYANSIAASDYNPTTGLREQWSGLSQLRFLKSLEQRPLEEVASELRELGAHLVNRAVLGVAINAEAAKRAEVVRHAADLAAALPSTGRNAGASKVSKQEAPAAKTFIGIPSSVHFVVKSFPAPHPWTAEYVHLDVLSKLLSSTFLHNEIREKGGAYGGGLGIGHSAQFYSYRDPHVARTVTTFGQAGDWVQQRKFTSADLDEAKLSIFADLDAPTPPSRRGHGRFFYEITDELRQQFRDRVFSTSANDLTAVASKYLKDGPSVRLAVVGNAETIKELDKEWDSRNKLA